MGSGFFNRSLPSSDRGVLSGFLPQNSVFINVPTHISCRVSSLAAEALYLSPVLSLELKRGFSLYFLLFSDWLVFLT